MKRSIFAILAAVALCSCGKSYTISGVLPEAGDSIFVMNPHEMTDIASAAVAEDGSFSIKGEFTAPQHAMLMDGNHQPVATLYIESGKINITADSLGRITISGTPANDGYNAYMKKMGELEVKFQSAANPEEQQAVVDESIRLAVETIKANSNNLLGATMFSGIMPQIEAEEAEELIAGLAEELQAREEIVSAKEYLEQKKLTEVGKDYIDITLPDTEGEAVALSSVMGNGKWTLLDFWATWCGPCRQQIPYIVEAYNEFKDKGFQVVAVSLDRSEEAWKAYLEPNGMAEWVNLIGSTTEQAAEEVNKYAFMTIPTNFLISPEGKIVARNLHDNELKELLQVKLQ